MKTRYAEAIRTAVRDAQLPDDGRIVFFYNDAIRQYRRDRLTKGLWRAYATAFWRTWNRRSSSGAGS